MGYGVCLCDTIDSMKLVRSIALVLFAQALAMAQTSAQGEPVVVFTDHPRLFLTASRLRLLKRERERNSPRWQQLDDLVTSDAPMPEPAFALALHYQISGNRDSGTRAVQRAHSPDADLRQLSLVYDWCQGVMTESQKTELAARIARGLAALGAEESVSTMRLRALAAVALYDDVPDAPARELQRVAGAWWNGKAAPALNAGRGVIPRADVYALFEMLFAIRDSANVDLRESCPRFFRELPIARLLTYYPAVFENAENDFRLGIEASPAQPDFHQAALSRAADLAMADYDPNLEQSQYMQGWLAHDRFELRGAFGAPYEFLWSNPYQPGLNYFLAPLDYYDAGSGEVFMRSDWQDSATWIGWSGGAARRFADGRLTALDEQTAATFDLGSAAISFGGEQRKFVAKLTEDEKLYAVALVPRKVYQVEIDDEEVYEAAADNGGVLELDLPADKQVGVRIRAAR